MKKLNRQTLQAGFNHLDNTHKLGVRRQVLIITLVKCVSLFSLIFAFYFFAHAIHEWVVDTHKASQFHIIGLSVALFISWLAQGLVNTLTLSCKSQLVQAMEQKLQLIFAEQQHALIRQHSLFYWQTLWVKHIRSIANWAFDYRVQQYVAVLVPLMALVVIFYVNPVIGVGLAIALPVVPLFMIVVGKGAASLHRKHFVALERLGGLFTDRLNALPLMASYRAHNTQMRLLNNASEQLNQRTMRVVGVAFLSSSVLDFFATLSVALVAVFIGFSLLGELSLGPDISLQQGLWVLLTVPLILSEMKKLGQVYHQKAEAEAASECLFSLFNTLNDDETAKKGEVKKRGVKNKPFSGFDAQDFRVSNLLSANHLKIAAGDHIRLNGVSGSGKTVLLEALAGHRNASHSFDGNCVWVSQTPVVLPGSVRDNLLLDAHYSDSALCEVLSSVELADWLSSLPDGLDTLMTEYPSLSGGEAQRLALARGLLRDPDIWLLDEPTAHIPDEQHHRLSQLIARVTQGKTVVWASHKLLPAHWFDAHWHIAEGEVTVK
ncbi:MULTISPECIES: ABC transporter ATP-binding protein/permease [Alteromonas]|uniref:ABC transporter ATP-binding protein n=1 Tax=Alteromonas stellipolaris TaxID=233316 RepID=A0ABN4LPM8_9ALTE|nr:ATP-binding cassette domain-containing protein [Alteromonas stellipolaris]ALM92786.1 Transport ATP-binding protein CydD [Alteromonas stellipolaris LMG 21856]AMJ75993.1 ABC transporter ATP-binding protein [Alteromonas stellipolaris]